MTTSRLLLDLLTTHAVTVLFSCTVTASTVLVIIRRALEGTEPQHRAAILRSVAEIARALRGRP
ncbi:hypothetical protein [Streptomyces sp. ISL-100]|uniref:hypothetical protein n=1 Tax=Streptomyces sp. ISL-100 TaxID=2819173 RepID=UPI001BEB2ED6|nr:hypothetical protein [Streptomyces sp. ISL-100]MBT2401859.1 hypothetical protein [Streptomyces sp. ISL-100]